MESKDVNLKINYLKEEIEVVAVPYGQKKENTWKIKLPWDFTMIISKSSDGAWKQLERTEADEDLINKIGARLEERITGAF
ncbi:MAG TPA: hypothetical protein VGC08_10750 [Pedobacter sp.]